ncbi:MAG: class I SAM-dependent methyltransferase [Candidatus Omnitrophica bacterium]|nr:class I SAM-dependent methyltransferase [Candidatus Omnitrophota bacterium]
MIKRDRDLEAYYKNPAIESWTYVHIGMENLQFHDPEMYSKIKEKQVMLLTEIDKRVKIISQICERLGLNNYTEIRFYIDQFLQKFPLGLRDHVAWDDVNFIFLYLLTKMLRPRIIIETGCNVGFSSTFIALAIKENDNGCMFYTMDPRLEHYPQGSPISFKYSHERQQEINYYSLSLRGKHEPLGIVPQDLRKYIIFKAGRSSNILPDLLKDNPKIDIFFHDSDHSYRNAIWECTTIWPYLRTGGYVLVHDVSHNLAFKEAFSKMEISTKEDNMGIVKKTDKDSIMEDPWADSLDNSRLNDIEYLSKKLKLESSPQKIIIQLMDSCSLNCVFCAGRKSNVVSNFDNFRCGLEGKISRYISQADKIIFKTCGGIFQSFEIENMIVHSYIDYFQESFPEVERIYFTNGLELTPRLCDFIIYSQGINNALDINIKKSTFNILLYASNSCLHKILTNSDSFSRIIAQVQYFLKLRKDNNNSNIHLIFVATTLNIEDLPDFVRLAADLGVDRVICYYNYIYVPAQKYLSCFFKQGLTNKMLDEAEKIAHKLNIAIDLPPRFGLKDYPITTDICREPWSQIMLNAQGHILPCDASEDTNESLEGKDFMDVWNGFYYQNLRKGLIKGSCSCFKHCFRANPASVNDFRSHVIHRGKGGADIDISWGDNFQ